MSRTERRIGQADAAALAAEGFTLQGGLWPTRRDAWAEDHRLVPEVEKPPHERGTCLYQPAAQRP